MTTLTGTLLIFLWFQTLKLIYDLELDLG